MRTAWFRLWIVLALIWWIGWSWIYGAATHGEIALQTRIAGAAHDDGVDRDIIRIACMLADGRAKESPLSYGLSDEYVARTIFRHQEFKKAGLESSTTICDDLQKLGSVSLLSSSLLLFVPLFVLAGFPVARKIVSWVIAGFR